MLQPQTWILNAKLATPTSSPNLARPRVALLAPRAGERILDIACGDGALTAKLASMGCQVIGVDASAAQFDATGKLGLDVRVTNGRAPDFDNEFDAVFSNAAMHWIRDPANVENLTGRSMNSQARVIGHELGRAPFLAASRLSSARCSIH